MTRRHVYEPGDKVKWPQTEMPAEENGRSLTVEDAIISRYQSGTHYDSYLYADLADRMLEDMQQNYDEEFDNIITICGGEGTGKSNLAHYIAKRYDPDFDMEKSLVYSWEQFLTSITEDPQKVYWFDEAILVAAGRDWMKEANKMLVSSLATIRFMRLLIIFVLPSLDSIDVYIRTFRTRYVLKAWIMQWTKDRKAVRGYAELKIPKTESERRSLKKDAKAEDYFKSVGFFRFPKMESSELYDRMKERNSNANLAEMRDKVQNKKTIYKRDKERLDRLISYLADEAGWSYKEIAAASGMPYDTVKGIAWRERNNGDDEIEE